MKRIFALLYGILLMAIVAPLRAQNFPPALGQHEDQPLLIGLRLEEVIKRFGSPHSVYVARGEETWQDDVVFMYAEGDFYIHRDRVWQIGVRSIFGMNIGDPKGAALLVLGAGAQDRGEYIICSLPGGSWPLSIRVNCSAGRIIAMYVYRPDY